MTLLLLKHIRTDGGTQPRELLDESVVRDYAEAMAEGDTFPPVSVTYDGNDYWLTDGYHRVAAARQLGLAETTASVSQGTHRDAVLASLGANATHGTRRTNSDKRRAVQRLLSDAEWALYGDREIARICRVTHPLVAKVRESYLVTVTRWDGSQPRSEENSTPITRLVTRGNSTYAMATDNIGKSRVQQYRDKIGRRDANAPIPDVRTRPALSIAAPQYLHDAVDDGEMGVAQAVAVWEALEAVSEATRRAAINAGLTTPESIIAWQEAAQTAPAFVTESFERGYVMDLDGEDMPLEQADSTLIRAAANEHDYERLLRQRTYINQNKAHVGNATGNNEWYTPPYLIEAARRVMGRIDCDPATSDVANRVVQASLALTAQEDGLAHPWCGAVFLNPPYSQPLVAQFAAAVVMKWQAAEIEQACVLVNNATDTAWGQALLSAASAVCFLQKRVKFLTPDGEALGAPLQGQMMVYLGQQADVFASVFGEYGWVMFPQAVSHAG